MGSAATPPRPPPSVKSSVTSRRSSATSPSTLSRRCRPLPSPRPSRRATSSQTARSSPSATSVSVLQRLSSSRPSSETGCRYPRDHLQLDHEVRPRHPKGPLRQHRHVWRYHHVLRHLGPHAEGDHRSCPVLDEGQDRRSPRAQVLCLDRWFHPRLALHLPADVDLEAGVRRERAKHRSQKMFLSHLPSGLSISQGGSEKLSTVAETKASQWRWQKPASQRQRRRRQASLMRTQVSRCSVAYGICNTVPRTMPPL